MISKYSVKKPFTVLVGVILVIVLGVVSLSRMTTDLLPDMSFPYALIVTTDVGASPEKVESDVTAPIEAAIATTSNIKKVTSTSYYSYSLVVCEYEQNANMDSTMIEIQQKLDQLKGQFATTVGTPMIMQVNPDMLPIMMTAVDMDNMNNIEITEYVKNELIPSLESVEGVASVNATGTITEHIQVTLDQAKIDALNEKIQAAIALQFEDPKKQLEDGIGQVTSGQGEISKGQKELANGFGQMLDGSDQLTMTEIDLKTKKSELEQTRTMLLASLEYVNKILESEEYKQYLQQQEAANQLPQNPAIQDSIANLQQQIAASISGQMMTELQGYLGALGIQMEDLRDLPSIAGQLSQSLIQVNAGIAAIDAGLEQVQAGKVQMSQGMKGAIEGAFTLSQTQATLAGTQSSLEQAKKTLEDTEKNAQDAANLNKVLSIDTLKGLLVAQNFDMPAGYVNDGKEQYLVRVGDAIGSVEDLEHVMLMDLGMDGIDPIHLYDIANLEVVDDSAKTYAIVNGNPAVMLSLEKQTGYSTGDVTDRILDKFKSLEKENEDLHTTVLMDQGIYIDLIVDSVVQNMVVGAILAIFVLLLFMKDVKPTLVIAASIPLSVITAIVLMYFTGISLNVISMSGLALGIGMLVDNSIVVIENIYRLRGEGLSIKKAAVEGAGQVAGAIVASTLTTVSVFAPIIFTDGITRQLFVDMGLTILFTLGASLLVALTFVPAMGSALLKRTKEIRHPWFDAMKNWYAKVLTLCLRFKPVVFLVAIGLLVGSAALSLSRGLTFMDMDMESNQISVSIQPKEGEKMEFEELTKASDEVISLIKDIDGIETIGATAGGNSTVNLMGGGSASSVSMYVLLEEDTKVSAKEVIAQIEEKCANLPYVVACNGSAMDMSAMFGSGISINIKGTNLDKMQDLAKQVAEKVQSVEGTEKVKDGLDNTAPEFRIRVNKTKAAQKGFTVAQVYQEVFKKMADTTVATTVSTDVKDYEVYIQTQDQSKASLDDIRNLMLTQNKKDGTQEEFALKDIADLEEATTLSKIKRDAQTRYLTVSAGIDAEHNITLVANKIRAEIDKIDVPEGFSIEMVGEDETINDAMEQMTLMLLLAVIFIYLIMVAQFQSLSSPFIIMFTIPLAFTGGFFALFLARYEVSVIAMLGFVMLAGLIVNNGIVLIDYINQARIAGASKKDAIVEAGKTRLRPILMTALTTILAMSTMALSTTQGSEMMKPMAITIIGGLIYGTVLTLIVVPCIYDAFHREKSMVQEEL